MKFSCSRLFLMVWLGLGCVSSAWSVEEQVDRRLAEAIILFQKEGPEATLPKFEDLAEEFAESGSHRDEAILLRYIGQCHWRLGNFDEARTHLELALTMKRVLADRKEEADTLNVLGLLEWDMGHYDEATANFRESSAIARELGDRQLQGMTLNNLSLVLDELGDYQTSLSQYRQVLDIYSGIDFPRGEGDTLGNIGGVYMLLGQYSQALDYYQKALLISQAQGSDLSMSQDHGNIALCYLGMGEVDLALENFDLAIKLTRKIGLRQDEAYWIGSKGTALIQKGRYDLGLENRRTALAIYEEVGAQAELLEALSELGRVLNLLGDPASAERYFTRAIELARQIRQARGITLNLMALGDLQYRREQFEEAEALYEEARFRSEKSGEKSNLSSSLLKLSLVHREQQSMGIAREDASRAQHIAHDIGAIPLESEALYSLAELDRREGHLDSALQGFTAAKDLSGENRGPELAWQIQFGRALALEAQGDKAGAVSALIEAVKVIEGVRDRLHEDRFRAAYVQDKYQVYVELVRLQLELGRDEDAFSTAERLRARSFSALVDRAAPSALTEDNRQLENELRQRIRQLQDSLAREQVLERPQQRQLAIENFSRELLLAEQDYQVFLDDNAHLQLPHGMAHSTPAALDVRSRLRPGDVLIEYVVGDDGVMVFVLKHDAMLTTITPVRRADLTARVALLSDLIRRPEDERWRDPASSLSAALTEPIEQAGWLADAQRIYIVPHDILNYLPFAVLPSNASGNTPENPPDRTRLLLDDYRLTYLPTAAVLVRYVQPVAVPQSLLAMAPARSRLRYAPEEARTIDAMFKPNSRLLAGDRATESRFKELAGDYNMLHFATHGYFNKFNPLLSGLELEADEANDGLLEVHEILGLELQANLVTLGACQTALGSGYLADVPAGDEFVGLTWAFLSAGSNSVLATLWEVDDRSSVQLMQRFYQLLVNRNQVEDFAGALSKAQRDLRSSDSYQHPYYWAPFVLVGNSGHQQAPVVKLMERFQ